MEQAMDPAERENLEEEWQGLKAGFMQLLSVVEGGYSKAFDHQEYMKLYTTVYNLCTKNRLDASNTAPQATEILYTRYGVLMTDYLRERQGALKEGGTHDALLRSVVKRWTNHKVIVRWMQKLFAYLDRYFTKHNNRDTLRDCGLKCFYNQIYEAVKDDLRLALFDNIQRERQAEMVDRTMLKEAINLFVEMGMESTSIYQRDFEQPFITFTEEYYERESSRWVSEDSATEYMKKAENRLQEELGRAQAYLHSESEKTLIAAVEQQILTKHQTTLLEMENSGFLALLRDQRLDDISRMYRLFCRIPKGLEPIAKLMREFVTNEGKEIVQKHSGSADLDFKAYTTDLLDLHLKYQAILSNQLKNDATFQKAVKDAFETFVNQPVQCNMKGAQPGTPAVKISSSELISNFCDMLMKNAGEKMGDDELDEKLEQVVALFGYISDKDLFQEFFRKSLSKRLLVSQVNEDAEKSLISKLKMRQGAPYTSRLEGMIVDRNLSSDLQSKFRDWQQAPERNPPLNFGFEFGVQVLTTGFWPAFQIHSLELPPQVADAQEKFRLFYDSRTQSRKLRWVHSLGNVTIDGQFKKGKYQLQMSCFQACTLLLFNSSDTYTGDELARVLTLPWEEVKKAVQSLAMGKYRLLIKVVPEGAKSTKAVDEGDTFRLNDDFSDKQRKLKIPNVVAKVNPKTSQQVQQTVEEDRRHAIEACIVRIMKSRKQMEHSLLIGECIQQLSNHFKPDPRHIKKRIEDLITREYIERDTERTNLYRYLA